MVSRPHDLLSPTNYDDDATSLHSTSARSDQESDSDDDNLLRQARTSLEVRTHDEQVLHDESDLEDLVQRTREKQNRRPSALAPIAGLFRSVTRSRERDEEDKKSSKNKGSGRRRRKERLMGRTTEGEDGVLMYEMEEGGLRRSSDDSEGEGRRDRERLGRLRNARVSGVRRRHIAIGALVAVAALALGILIWAKPLAPLPSATSGLVSNGTALFGPTTIIVSLDGFRADFLKRGLTPRLSKFIAEGVSPPYMLPSFPSVTFPNHYTLATGLFPEAHGIVGNTFWDEELQEEFYYTDPSRSQNPKWWGGEPFWVTAEKAGVRTGVHMWPGSEAHIGGIEPSFLDKFNGQEKLDKKVARVLEFLDKPGKESPEVPLNETRPQLIAFYVPDVDADGHHFGPNSTEIRKTITAVDTMLDTLFVGLEQRNLTHIVNVIIVSDHGMATTDVSRVIQLDNLVDLSKISHKDGWPLVGLRFHNDSDIQPTYESLKSKLAVMSNPNFDVYLRDSDMPTRYHFSNNPRIAPLWIIPKTGWAIAERSEFDVKKATKKGTQFSPRGLHGYDHEHPLMRAIFIARGPAFPHQNGSRVDPFQNTEVYGMVCQSLGITMAPNNRTMALPLVTTGVWTEADWSADGDKIDEEGLWSMKVPSSTKTKTTTKSTSSTSTSSVTTTTEGPASITVTGATSTTTAATSAPSTGPPKGQDGQESDSDSASDADTLLHDLESVWDWLQHTAQDLAHKITGSSEQSPDSSAESPP